VNDFIVIYLKNAKEVTLDNILEIVKKDYTLLEMWQSQNSNFTLLNVLNNRSSIKAKEQNNYWFSGIKYIQKRYRFLYSGYLTTESDDFISTIQFRNGSLYTEPSGGIACFCLYDELSKKVFMWSTLPPVKPIFYSENKDVIVAGTRPRIVHLCAKRCFKATLSDNYLPSVLADGYALGDITPYDKTYILPIRKTLVIHERYTDFPKIIFAPYPVNPYQDLYYADFDSKVDLLCDELISSVQPLKNAKNPELWLSGGKDSRLLAALMKAANIDAHFSSFDTINEQFEIAASVASRLGFPFSVNSLQFNHKGNLSDSVKYSLNLSDGFIHTAPLQISYDLTPSVDDCQAVIVGHAHLQKGGFAYSATKLLKPILDKAYSSFLHYSLYLKPIPTNLNLKFVDDFISNFNVRSHLEILYWLNFDFRVSKYLLPHYLEMSSQRLPVYPLIDEKVCRILSGLNMNDKIFELVMFGALKKLAPEIADIPLYKSQWKFEQGGQPYPGFEDGYESRTSAFVADNNIRWEGENKQSKNFLNNSLKQSEFNSPDEFSGKLGMQMFERISNSSIFPLLKEYLKDEVCLAISECNYNHIVALNQKHQLSNQLIATNFIWLLYSLVILYDEF
jgi:hypothetical protein